MNSAVFGPDRTIVWLASYPKSGNTWLRALLTKYLCPDEPIDLNQLIGGPLTFERSALDDFAAIDSSLYSPAALIPYQSAYHRSFALGGMQPTFAKTHSAFVTTNDGVALFPQEASAGAIVIVRDPRDIVASYAHHEGKSLEQVVVRMADPDALQDFWPDHAGNSLPQLLSSWSDNVASWLDQSSIPVHLVRYEDLLDDTAAQLCKVVRFCGLQIEDGLIAAAVDACRFGRLKAAESTGRFTEKPRAGRSFFRAGKSGDGASETGEVLTARVVRDHRRVMQRVGYCQAG